MTRRLLLLILGVTLTAPALAQRASRTGTAAAPNIVLFLADDLGIGEIGPWGQTEILTPNIDRLAHDGMRLTEVRSSATAGGPARCSLMTALHSGHCRLDENNGDYLRPSDLTLAERLKARGYATGLFGTWGLSADSQPASWPNAQGFDAFFGYRDQGHAHNYYPEFLIRNTDSVKTGNVVERPGHMGAGRATVRVAYAPDLIGAQAFAFVRRNAKKPFFLYWATSLPHINTEGALGHEDGGYEITDLGPYADRSWPLARKSYAAQVRRIDQDLGHLRALLDSLGIARRTLIIFLSDNGATFLRGAEHAGISVIGRWFNGTLNYRGFKGDLYDGGLRVPAVVAWPGRIKPGSTSAVRTDFTDVHATIVAAAGLSAPKNIDGRSVLPALVGRGAVAARDHYVWFSPDRNQSAVLFGGWKAVWMRDTLRLFNVTSDPGETRDLAQLQPDVVRRLTEIRDREDKRVTHRVPPSP